jgi:PIN domain nuclease of toxin-antitoxin system
MRLLLDTHVLLWAVLEPHKLSPQLRETLEDSRHELLVSAASAWEIATKWRLGKLPHAASVVHNYHQAIHGLAATELAISGEAALRAGLWPVDHRDPFDRILAAQAALQELVLATTDPAFSLFAGVERLS